MPQHTLQLMEGTPFSYVNNIQYMTQEEPANIITQLWGDIILQKKPNNKRISE